MTDPTAPPGKLDTIEITEDLIGEAMDVKAFIPKLKTFLAVPKDQRKYADLGPVLGITPDGFLGAQLAMIDTIEEQAKTP